MMENRAALKEGILTAVEEQLHSGAPPETKRTFDRLVQEGYSAKEAKGLIGGVLACEMYEILHNHRDYDSQRYTRALQALPQEEVYGDNG